MGKDFKVIAANIVSKMSLEDKCASMSQWSHEIPGLVPHFNMGYEAAHGVQARHDQPFDMAQPEYTTVFPNPVGMAASWDVELMEKTGEVTGIEMRSFYNEGRNECLCPWAPTVDMERDPRWGRNEEAYGEDPLLAGKMAAGYIRGMRGNDPDFIRCGATLKHFYGNNVECGRTWKSTDLYEKIKWEYYLEVFRLTIKYGNPEAAMTSYNSINGVPSVVNPEVRNVLKKWGLSHVVCDANAMRLSTTDHKYTKSNAEAAALAVKAGVDAFAEPKDLTTDAIKEAVEKGWLCEADLDEALTNRFVTFAKLGLFEEETVFGKDEYNMSRVRTAENAAVSRKLAAESIVLLKNRKSSKKHSITDTSKHFSNADNKGEISVNDKILPLAKNEKIAVLGPFADTCPVDWYSGIPEHMVSVKEAIPGVFDDLIPLVRIRIGDDYLGISSEEETLANKYMCFMVNNASFDGKSYKVVKTDKEQAEVFQIMLWDDKRITLRSMKTGKLLTTKQSYYGHTNDGPQGTGIPAKTPEYVNVFPHDVCGWFSEEIFYLCDKQGKVISFTDDNAADFWKNENVFGMVTYANAPILIDEKGNLYQGNKEDLPSGLVFETVSGPIDRLRGKEALAEYDTALVCVGLHPMVNCREERDRESIELPPFQRAIVRMAGEHYENVILLLLANAPLAVHEESISQKTGAILWSAQGSQELGWAVSDVLYGYEVPAGRLNMTWYKSDKDLPEMDNYDIINFPRTYQYFKGEVLYPFGYGLLYTEFEYSDLMVEKVINEEVTVGFKVTFNIKNTGNVSADEVAQVYFRKECEGQIRPLKRLAGFDRIRDIQPGESRYVEVMLDLDDMRFYDEKNRGMVIKAGEYEILVEKMSAKILL